METYREKRTTIGSGMASDPFLSVLFQPSAAYRKPSDVLKDENLTLYEKKAVLASWASDAWAVESAPALRAPSDLTAPASIDDIMLCLKLLDEEVRQRCIRWERSHEASK